MSGKKWREHRVTRTEDNRQMGLSILIESLALGETVTFIEKAALEEKDRVIQELVGVIQRVSDGVKNGKADIGPGVIYDICQITLAKHSKGASDD